MYAHTLIYLYTGILVYSGTLLRTKAFGLTGLRYFRSDGEGELAIDPKSNPDVLSLARQSTALNSISGSLTELLSGSEDVLAIDGYAVSLDEVIDLVDKIRDADVDLRRV